MKAFTVRDAVNATGGRYYGPESALDNSITFVTGDSRVAKESALFVAFVGARVDGHSFMAQCIEKGAACCLSEREPTEAEMPCIQVESSLRAIGKLAAWHRSRFDIPVVGITGSVGKTTTKEMVASVLRERYVTHKTDKNFNNELGVPQTLLRLDDTDQVSVVEMGISDFGEMRRLTNMVRPKIAVMSIIGDAHLEFLHDYQGVLRAKGEIFESMSDDDLAILNGDDATLKTFTPHTRKLTYGLEPQNDFVATDIENLGAEGTRCVIHHGDESFEAFIPAYGVHMVYAALAGTAVGYALGMTWEEIARGISHYETVGDRARIIDTGNVTIISDCYNANPSSVCSAIDSLATLEGRKVCILGDMLELGEKSAEYHAQTGKHAVNRGIDLVLCAGSLSRATAKAVQCSGGTAFWAENKEALAKRLPEFIRKGDHILVKASHSMAFEQLIPILQQLTF